MFKIHLLHHDDLDGCGAAAAVVFALRKDQVQASLAVYPMDYDLRFPLSEIGPEDRVIVVDFSMQPATRWFDLLKVTKDVVWIDHHVAAMEEADRHDLSQQLPGLRRRDVPSACVLAWQYFLPDVPVPESLRLISQFDTWTHHDEPAILDTVYGLMAADYRPLSPIWPTLFHPLTGPRRLKTFTQVGATCRAYDTTVKARFIRRHGFKVSLYGRSFWAANVSPCSSLNFDAAMGPNHGFDGWLSFYFNGRTYTFSLYAVRDDLDVSEIARRYGGGGHQKAAGFQSLYPPTPQGIKLRDL